MMTDNSTSECASLKVPSYSNSCHYSMTPWCNFSKEIRFLWGDFQPLPLPTASEPVGQFQMNLSVWRFQNMLFSAWFVENKHLERHNWSLPKIKSAMWMLPAGIVKEGAWWPCETLGLLWRHGEREMGEKYVKKQLHLICFSWKSSLFCVICLSF